MKEMISMIEEIRTIRSDEVLPGDVIVATEDGPLAEEITVVGTMEDGHWIPIRQGLLFVQRPEAKVTVLR